MLINKFMAQFISSRRVRNIDSVTVLLPTVTVCVLRLHLDSLQVQPYLRTTFKPLQKNKNAFICIRAAQRYQRSVGSQTCISVILTVSHLCEPDGMIFQSFLPLLSGGIKFVVFFAVFFSH